MKRSIVDARKLRRFFYSARRRLDDVYQGWQRINPALRWGLGGIVSLLGFYGTLVGLGVLPAPVEPFTPMSGDIRIAVAGFTMRGDRAPKDLGDRMAANLSEHLKDLLTAPPGTIVRVRGPHEVERIRGDDAEQLAAAAERIAERHQANIVIYGEVDATRAVWHLTPKFYIFFENAYESQEITGPLHLGSEIELGSNANGALTKASEQLSQRAELLANIAVGLFYFGFPSEADRQKAIPYYEKALNTPAARDRLSRQMVELLLGNAYLKTNQFETAWDHYEEARTLDPFYARPYIGLGSVTYRRAILRFEKSGSRGDIDPDLLLRSIAYYEQAAKAPDQPELADIQAKVDFGVGQCRLMLWLANRETGAAALQKFDAVIQNYGDGRNPRLVELAAEAHARKALYAFYTNDMARAIAEYKQAAALLEKLPARRQQYLDRAADIQAGALTPYP